MNELYRFKSKVFNLGTDKIVAEKKISLYPILK